MSSSDNITLSTNPNDPTDVPIMLSTCYGMDRSWWNQHLFLNFILLEALHLFPPLCRLLRRAFERGSHGPKPNMSEIIFTWMYFWNVVGGLGFNLNWYRPYPTRRFCHGTGWAEAAGTHLAAAVVPLGMAQRAIAVWSQGGIRRWPIWTFTSLGLVHFAWTVAEMVYADKATSVEAGSCATPQALVDEIADLRAWDYPGFYFLLWSLALDAGITASTVYKLMQNKGPFGWLGFSRLLFENSIHYFAVVTLVNLVQFSSFCECSGWTIVMTAMTHAPRLPSFHASVFPKSWHYSDNTVLAFAIITVLAMNLLAKEQDYVHGYRPAGSDSVRHNIESPSSPATNSQSRSGGGSGGRFGSLKGTLSRLKPAGSPRDQEAAGGHGFAEHSRSSLSVSRKNAPSFSREGSSTSVPMTRLPSVTYGGRDAPSATLFGGTSIHKDTSNGSQEVQRARSTTMTSKQSSSEGLGRVGGSKTAEGEGWLTGDEKTMGAKPTTEGSPA